MSSSPCYLLTLPRELRDLIYHFTFTSPGDYATTLSHSQILHPLTQVSQQLRKETLQPYFNLTRFNAHLDDGPAAPLARWLVALGPEQCLWLREVGVWDMHMLNGTLLGSKAAARMLHSHIGYAHDRETGSNEDNGDLSEMKPAKYTLQPIGRDIFHGSWYLKDIILALQDIGLGLQRFCEILNRSENDADEQHLKQTSCFAIVPAGNEDDDCGLASQFGLSASERESISRQLIDGERMIQINDGRRNITLTFDDQGRRLVAIRQQFIPREEEFYM